MSDTLSDRTDFPAAMYQQLGALCRARYHAAISEGMSEQAAFEEIVHVILDTYREAIAS